MSISEETLKEKHNQLFIMTKREPAGYFARHIQNVPSLHITLLDIYSTAAASTMHHEHL